MRVEASIQQKMAGKPAPEIDTTDLNTGKPVRLADFRGKVVVLDFWGYWCGPCTGAMPHLAALHRKFAGRPVAVVALHDQSVQSRADYDRRVAFARKAFWNGEDLPFRVLLDRPDPDKAADRDPEGTGVTCKRYGIVGFPTVFVIDQEGKIVAPVRHTDHDGLERLVERLLNRAAGGDGK
jgi:thiol-disulfide isomerase/thioredoxin